MIVALTKASTAQVYLLAERCRLKPYSLWTTRKPGRVCAIKVLFVKLKTPHKNSIKMNYIKDQRSRMGRNENNIDLRFTVKQNIYVRQLS